MKKMIVSIIIICLLLNTAPLSICGKEAVNENMSDAGEPILQVPSNNFDATELEYLSGQMIIKFGGDEIHFITSPDGILTTGILELDRLNKKYGVTQAEQVFKTCSDPSMSSIYTFTLDASADIPAVVAEYNKDPRVIYAEPNNIYITSKAQPKIHPDNFPNDPYFNQQWSLNQPNDCDIDAPEAWDIETGSSDVVIAVVDTGVDYNHEDLFENIWINPGEDLNGNGVVDPSDFNDIDDDNNGFIDDIRGWDFVDIDTEEYIEEGFKLCPDEDYIERDNDPMDAHGHGTHCSGIASAVTNNDIGISGVCWNSYIMPIRSGFKIKYGFGTYGILEHDDTAAGIIYAADNDADVISMSWGSSSVSQLIKDAVDYAYEKGVFLVASAGNYNNNKKIYPAAYTNVIAVAATTKNDIKAEFSNYGSWVDVAAPGVNILSTLPNNSYDKRSGTSMACPHVAGLAGLILSKNINFNQDQVKDLIIYSADRVIPYYDIGQGRINAYEAFHRGPGPATAVINSPSHGAEVEGFIDIIGTATGEGFRYFTLEYGKGIRPDENNWIELLNFTIELENETLASFDTSILFEGLNRLKLTVVCDNGKYVDVVWLFVDYIENTFYVDEDGGPGVDFTSIAMGVFVAGTDDTVYVFNGTYYESIYIVKPINLFGENSTNTIIDGMRQAKNIIWVYANMVNISGFTIQNTYYSGNCAGIRIYSSGNTINNNKFYENLCDINIDSSSNNIIHNNTFKNGFFGSPISNKIYDNKFIGGLSIGGYNNIIKSNTIIIIGGNLFGIDVSGNYNIVDHNIILGSGSRINNGICVWGHCHVISNNIINGLSPYRDGFGPEGIRIRSKNCTIYGNYITNFGSGMVFYKIASDNIIYHNNFIDNGFNVYWEDWDFTLKNKNYFYNSTLHEGNYWDDYKGFDILPLPDGDGIGDTPYIVGFLYPMCLDWYPLMQPLGNHHPPEIPSKPEGPTNVKTGKTYNYTTSTTDSDGHLVRYCWHWELVDTEWTDFYQSAETVTISHTWDFCGIHLVKVKAEDIYGFETEWSDPLTVLISNNYLNDEISNQQQSLPSSIPSNN